MERLFYILAFASVGSLVSLLGAIALVSRESLAKRVAEPLGPFAAGALLGTAFVDLLPESIADTRRAGDHLLVALAGIVIFFFLERTLSWFHHHRRFASETHLPVAVPLVILGDTLHNFIDGVVIAGTFLVSIPLGVTTSIAVALHEIPQEIGDFGVLLYWGVERRKIVLWNIISALATIVAAVVTYAIGEQIANVLPDFLALTAGFFIYIATSDMIPEIHRHDRKWSVVSDTLLLVVGIVVIALATKAFD